jgi:hypothetical protein
VSGIEVGQDLYGELVKAASKPGFSEWLGMVRASGGCAEPIHLWGESLILQAGTGELLSHRPPGRLLVSCGNRRKTRCPSCSETYRSDTFQLIKAGLVGGKTVPEAVAGHPKVFATFTAPSFGPVHHRVSGRDGEVARCHPHGPVPCERGTVRPARGRQQVGCCGGVRGWAAVRVRHLRQRLLVVRLKPLAPS